MILPSTEKISDMYIHLGEGTMSTDSYRRFARGYDLLLESAGAGLRAVGLKMHPPTQAMRVLDIGCGTGTSLALYQQAGCQVFGIDSSPTMLDVARRKVGDRAGLCRGSAAAMPYAGGQFDLILAMLVLHELPPETVMPFWRRPAARSIGMGILLIDFHPVRCEVWGLVDPPHQSAGGARHRRGSIRNYRRFMAQRAAPASRGARSVGRAGAHPRRRELRVMLLRAP
jgi:SAM-dependent methyltransferase